MFDYTAAHKLLASRRKFPTTIRYLWTQVAGLSEPSKMPWLGWSISASRCKVGGMLRAIEGSVCSDCYACKGRYLFDNVQTAHERRLAAFDKCPAEWAANMVTLIEAKARGEQQHFRWFDSGDLQSRTMLEAIVWIAKQLPHIAFWLPTKEAGLLREPGVKELVASADNLTVRLSAPMLGQANSNSHFPTASVGAGADAGFACPAYSNDGKCGDCRACWDKGVPNVDYPQH